ncbi:MAG: hypothetical protein ACYDG2_24145 [Ruminiclostridium sp.]
MLIPYIRCPFISHCPNMMYSPQSPEFPGEQYLQQPIPSSMYPMQTPYGMYEDNDNPGIGPITKFRQDPPPVLSNNPVTASIILFKELTAYPNYGNPSRNADILYTRNQGTWTFESPALLFVPGNQRAQIRIRAVLDDHANVPVNSYSARITINGNIVHNGRVPLVHGSPAGGIFTNWRELPFNITNLRRITRVTIENTSTAGVNDWIAFDWMEMRLIPR